MEGKGNAKAKKYWILKIYIFNINCLCSHNMAFYCTPWILYGLRFPQFVGGYNRLYPACIDSFWCVEYFFIISGFFLYFHLINKKDDTFSFAINRLKRLLPLFIFSLVCIFVLSLFKFCEYYSYSNILNLFLLRCVGFQLGLVNNPCSWFICALFWSSLFYHYLYRNFSRKIVNLIIFIVSFYSFCLILSFYSTVGIIPGAHWEMIAAIPGGLLRGFASIGLGYFIGMLSNTVLKDMLEKYDNMRAYKKYLSYFVNSSLEIYLFLFIVNNSIFHKIRYENDFIFIIVFSLLFLLFIAKKGLLSNLLENNISALLGKYSYSI